jgi:hypothetical protein
MSFGLVPKDAVYSVLNSTRTVVNKATSEKSIAGGEVIFQNLPTNTGDNVLYIDSATGIVSKSNGGNIPTGELWGQYLYYNTDIGSFATGGTKISLGTYAGENDQGANAVALGFNAGSNTQGTGAVAIGNNAGFDDQGANAVALGLNAGKNSQGTSAIAIGNNAGINSQGQFAVAIGINAGGGTQGTGAIAIGNGAGNGLQGANAIAIGSGAGFVNQNASTIVLNATGGAVNTLANSSFYVQPIRSVAGGVPLSWNAATGEVSITPSQRATKNTIVDIADDTSVVFGLQARNFMYNADENKEVQVGYIAEEVEELNRKLAIHNVVDGAPVNINYNVVLVFLVEEVRKLRAQVDALLSTN